MLARARSRQATFARRSSSRLRAVAPDDIHQRITIDWFAGRWPTAPRACARAPRGRAIPGHHGHRDAGDGGIAELRTSELAAARAGASSGRGARGRGPPAHRCRTVRSRWSASRPSSGGHRVKPFHRQECREHFPRVPVVFDDQDVAVRCARPSPVMACAQSSPVPPLPITNTASSGAPAAETCHVSAQ